MTEIYIDDQKLEIDETLNASITLSIANIENLDSSDMGYTKTLEIPITPHNREVFGFTEQVFSAAQFNNAVHLARIVSGGITVMAGYAVMSGYKDIADNKGYYSLNIVGSTYGWVKQAQKQALNEIDSEGIVYAEQEVFASALVPVEQYPLIRFIPVDRGAFWEEDGEGFKPRTELMLYDYYPFINIWRLLGLIMNGWEIVSSLKAIFQKLYMSGMIVETEDSSDIEEANTFKVGTKVYDSTMVDGTPRQVNMFNTVDTSIASDLDANEVVYEGTRMNPTFLFKPKNNMSVRFDLNIAYESAVDANGAFADRIVFGSPITEFNTRDFRQVIAVTMRDCAQTTEEASRKFIPSENNITLKGKIYIDTPARNEGRILALQYSDYMRSSGSPLAIDAVARYYIFGTIGQNSGWYDFEIERVRSYESAALGFYKQESPPPGSMVGKTIFEPFDDDTRVAVVFEGERLPFLVKRKTKAYTLSAGEGFPLYVAMYTTGTTPLSVQILDGSTISPSFKSMIGYGDTVNLRLIGGEEKQIEVVKALRQMFNLRIYTNDIARKVYIEPDTQFYNDEVIDWSGKIDLSQAIELEELGSDIGTALTLRYASGSEAVEAYNKKKSVDYGAFRQLLENKAATSETESANSFFHPCVEAETNIITEEFDGMEERDDGVIIVKFRHGKLTLLQMGISDEDVTIDDVDFNVPRTICMVNSITPYLTGIIDGDSSSYYPVAKFYDKERTLTFDNSEGRPGLRRYYERVVDLYNYGRRITAYINLEARDVEPLLFPGSSGRDFRALYKLRIRGEEVYARLESISDYNPSSGASTKCSFIVNRKYPSKAKPTE